MTTTATAMMSPIFSISIVWYLGLSLSVRVDVRERPFRYASSSAERERGFTTTVKLSKPMTSTSLCGSM